MYRDQSVEFVWYWSLKGQVPPFTEKISDAGVTRVFQKFM